MSSYPPYVVFGPVQIKPVIKPKRDDKKVPPNATLTDPLTGDVATCSVRSIGVMGAKGKIVYCTIKRINAGSWLDKKGFFAVKAQRVRHHMAKYPLLLNITNVDEFTPDYFKTTQFLTLRYISYWQQNTKQFCINTAVVTPLDFSENVEDWRERLEEKKTNS